MIHGEPVHLDAGGHQFLALHTEAGDDGPRKAVIVLHGRGFHPDLRNGRQTPVLGKSAR